MLNEMKAKKINEEALEMVAGGTVKEYEEIVSAFANNPTLKKIAGLSVHVPGANEATVGLVKGVLGEMNIDADIDLGYLGTGLGSKNNKYTDRISGQSMSHSQVIARIRRYTKDIAI
jgi:hypothetical protein